MPGPCYVHGIGYTPVMVPIRSFSATRPAARAVLALVGASVVAAACGAPPPLADTSASAEEVMRHVLIALARTDRPRLEALAITEQEFKDHVWGHLPAARPERNLPMSYVWGDLRQKSHASLARALQTVDGRALELVRVRFAAPPRRYGPLVVYGGTTVVVRGPDGTAEDLRVCGSLVERDGRWKVFSYVIDD